MVSNIINNAVEAILASKNKENGAVNIKLSATPEYVVVQIKDNGYGMPAHIQEKFLQEESVSEGKKDGHGIGLLQIHKTITAYNGKCKIFASADKGTEFVVKFPISSPPNWIATEIKVNIDDKIIILDDDDSIHGAWDSKFKHILEEFPSIKVEHRSNGTDVIDFINNLSEEQQNKAILLSDYELLNQGINGLDVIARANIKRAILVTSHASKAKIQELVKAAGIKALPKELAPVIPIVVNKKIDKWSKHVDMVWVEDQKYFVDAAIRNFYKHLKVDVYYDPDSFMEYVEQYPLDTRIILDTYYYTHDGEPYTLDGFTIAKKLHHMGYTKLILCAGEVLEPERTPHYLTIILKDDAKGKANLDKI